MPGKSYQLINPVIEGTFNDTVDSAKTPIIAAEKIWGRIAEHVSGHVPKFMFSIRSIDDSSMNHFEVKEKLSDGSYTIKELSIDVNPEQVDEFHSDIDNMKEQAGGASSDSKRRRHKKYNKDGRSLYPKDSSSSSDDSDTDSDGVYSGVEFTTRSLNPIAMFHYTTKFYHQHDGRVFEHQSTTNPSVTIVDPIPVVPVVQVAQTRVVPTANVIRTARNFATIPVFKTPLLPVVTIW